MNKKILIGSIIAVSLLTLVSFSSVVGYQSVENNPDNTIITDEYDSYSTLQLVFQLISKLPNHKDIKFLKENINSVEDVDGEILRIIEGDVELNYIFEILTHSNDDCGCDDNSEDLTSNTQSNKGIISKYPLIIEKIIEKSNNNDLLIFPKSIVNITRCLVLFIRLILLKTGARIVGTSLTLIYSFLSKFGDIFSLEIIDSIGFMLLIYYLVRQMIISSTAWELQCFWQNFFPLH